MDDKYLCASFIFEWIKGLEANEGYHQTIRTFGHAAPIGKQPMMGTTHIAIGALCGLVLSDHLGLAPIDTLGVCALCGFSAILPDIDHPNSAIRNRMDVAGDLVFGFLRHRGITHSLIALLGVAIILLNFAPSRIGAFAVITGYASHLVADFLTPNGIPLLIPFSSFRFRIPLIRSGGCLEHLLFLGLIGFCGRLLFLRFWFF